MTVDKTRARTYCPKCHHEWNGTDYSCPKCDADIDGVFCPELDALMLSKITVGDHGQTKIKFLETWSDCNVHPNSAEGEDSGKIRMLECRHCTGQDFAVLATASYETSARCKQCGMWYVVHSG
jgi:hypothetical protein